MELHSITTADGNIYQLNQQKVRMVLSPTPANWGLPPTSYNTKRFYKQDGETELSFNLNPRRFTLQVTNVACSREELFQFRQDLLNFLRSNRNGQLTYTFINEGGIKRSIVGRALTSPFSASDQDSWDEHAYTGAIDLLCHDPIWFDPDIDEASLCFYLIVHDDAYYDWETALDKSNTSLISWWTLDEVSGNRADSFGSNDLTDHNTVTSNPGKHNLAGQFTAANSEYLSIANNATLQTGDIDFYFCGWIYLDSLPSVGASMVIVAKWTTATNNREYLLYINTANDQITFTVDSDGLAGGSVTVVATTYGALSVGVWYFFEAFHDSVNNEIGVAVNRVENTQAHAAGVFVGVSNVFVGSQLGTSWFMNGRIDELCFMKRIPSERERDWLFRTGDGRAYFDIIPRTQLAQSFQLDEAADVQSFIAWMLKVGTPTDGLTISLCHDNAGDPGAVIATSGTVPEGDINVGAIPTALEFCLAAAQSLLANTTYWLTMDSDGAADDDDFVQWCSDLTESYTDGEMKSEQSGSWVAESKDAIFAILCRELAQHLVFPITFPIMFGAADEWGETTISYAGTWYTYPIIRAYGPFDRLEILHQETGYKLNYLGSAAAGEWVEFDLRQSYGDDGSYEGATIIDQDGNNRYGYLSPDSNPLMFRIEPDPIVANGENSFLFTAPGYTSDTDFTLTYYTRYIGI